MYFTIDKALISLETFLKWKNNNCKNITKDADKQLKKFFEIVLPSSTAFFNGRAQQERNIPHLIFKSQYQTNFGENLKPTVSFTHNKLIYFYYLINLANFSGNCINCCLSET